MKVIRLTSSPTVADLAAHIQPTPITMVRARYRGRSCRIRLKRECALPTGSLKFRTAVGLLTAAAKQAPLTPGAVVVESTSGGLGCAMAHVLSSLGCEFVAVIDPKTPPATRRALADAGATVHCVSERDRFGGYLLTRLRFIADLCAAHPEYRWTNQYRNPANPHIHAETTGPEILAQGGRGLDAVYVAVSTGGTLAGIASHLRTVSGPNRPVRIVAVDAAGSQALTAQPCLPRVVPGIGSSRRALHLGPASYDRAAHVTDAAAIATCLLFHEDTGIRLGGSSGHVLRACVGDMAGATPPVSPLCVCADDGARYADTLYDQRWLAASGLSGDVDAERRALRDAGLRFDC